MMHPLAGERGCTIWLTGNADVPRGELALAVGRWLRAAGRRVEVIDGDEVRGRTPRGRDAAEHIGWVCRALSRNGVFVVAATSSPAPPRTGLASPAPLVEVHVTAAPEAAAPEAAAPAGLAVSPRAMGERACVDAVIAALRARGHLH